MYAHARSTTWIWIVALVALPAAGVGCGQPQQREGSAQAPREQQAATQESKRAERSNPLANSANSDSSEQEFVSVRPLLSQLQSVQTNPANAKARTDNQQVRPDLGSTSWQDPFLESHWRSDGWTFTTTSMQSSRAENTVARFRWRYKKLMLKLNVEPIGSTARLRLLLATPDDTSITIVDVTPAGVSVSAEAGDQHRVIAQRNNALDLAPGKPGELQLAATGNRIVVIWNQRRILSCAQPAEQSGCAFEFTLASRSSMLRITALRIEGEE